MAGWVNARFELREAPAVSFRDLPGRVPPPAGSRIGRRLSLLLLGCTNALD